MKPLLRSKKSPTGPTERSISSTSNLPRGPLVRSHSIFDGSEGEPGSPRRFVAIPKPTWSPGGSIVQLPEFFHDWGQRRMMSPWKQRRHLWQCGCLLNFRDPLGVLKSCLHLQVDATGICFLLYVKIITRDFWSNDPKNPNPFLE